jgi:hypothetical protein
MQAQFYRYDDDDDDDDDSDATTTYQCNQKGKDLCPPEKSSSAKGSSSVVNLCHSVGKGTVYLITLSVFPAIRQG